MAPVVATSTVNPFLRSANWPSISAAVSIWGKIEDSLAQIEFFGDHIVVSQTTENVLNQVLFLLRDNGLKPVDVDFLIRRDFGETSAEKLSLLLDCYDFYQQEVGKAGSQTKSGEVLDLSDLQVQLWGPRLAEPLFSGYRDFYRALREQGSQLLVVVPDKNGLQHAACTAVREWNGL